MHPFAKARERTRALNAAKIDRIFAKPFVAALEGHLEAVETMSRRPESLTAIASGSWDGGMYASARYSEVLVLHGSHPLQVSSSMILRSGHT